MSPQKREYSIPSGLGVWKKQLINSFPDERKAIETFFSMVKRVNHQIKGWILVKVLPLWLVNLMNLFGLPRFLSDFYAWDGHTLTEVIEVINHCKFLVSKLKFYWFILIISTELD
jgi:all-trans-retinol 13,14-reductase